MAANVAIALLILRLVGGVILAAHGVQKLFGWFDGPGMVKWEQGLQAQGFKPARFWAYLNILGEVGGGLSLIFGFLTPLGAAGGVGAMVMAMGKAHWKNGFFNSKRGIEFTLAVLAIATAVGLAGPGTISLDQLFGILPSTLLFIILALVGLLVDIVGLMMTRPAPSAGMPSSASS
ncbi:MAG TPA: DoxX family protein [Ktedonobacterales bacterium]|nr:DoxX family protein [Ktedonobacterales bacterium]